MCSGPIASGRHIDLAGVGLDVDDEVRNGFHRHGWVRHDKGRANDARGGRDVADKIEIELVVERRADRVRRTDPKQRIAVRDCSNDRLGANIAARTGPILNDEGLTEPLRQPLTHHTRSEERRVGKERTSRWSTYG